MTERTLTQRAVDLVDTLLGPLVHHDSIACDARAEQYRLAEAWLRDGVYLERGTVKPVCSRCNDTHVMTLADRTVACTACPTPCERCRGERSAYCKETPCTCWCHMHVKPVPVATRGDLAVRCVQLERQLELAMHWGAALLEHHIDETTSLIAKLQQLRGTEPGVAYTLGRRDGLAVGAHQHELIRDLLRAADAWVDKGTVYPTAGEPLTDAVCRWRDAGKPGLSEP